MRKSPIVSRYTLPLCAALALGLGAGPVAAQDWFVRFGAVQVNPDSDNGRLAGGTLAATVDNNNQIGLILGRHFTPNLALEILAATPFSHTASVNGAEAVDFKHLPPTVSLQWYFLPEARFNPFVGLGVNYTYVYDEETRGPLAGTEVSLENSFGVAAQLGVAVKLNDSWDLVVDARQIDIDSDVKVNGADVGTVTVDPRVYGLTFSYKF